MLVQEMAAAAVAAIPPVRIQVDCKSATAKGEGKRDTAAAAKRTPNLSLAAKRQRVGKM